MSTQNCPFCGAALEADSVFCGACGARIPTQRVCSRCAAPLKEGDVFCAQCGANALTGGKVRPEKAKPLDRAYSWETEVPRHTPAQQAPKPPAKKAGKKKKTALIILSVIAFLFIGTCIGVAVYFNSEPARIEAAQRYIRLGDFERATARLEPLGSEQAQAVRDYLECAKIIEDFRLAFSSADSNADHAQFNDRAEAAIWAIEYLEQKNSAQALPAQLQSDFEYYKKIAAQLRSETVTESMLADVQLVFYNLVLQNRQEYYTMKELQENINASNSALTQLSSALRSIPAYSEQDPQLSLNLIEQKQYQELVQASSVYMTLIQKAQKQCTMQQNRIDENLKNEGWDMNSQLFLTEPNKEFTYTLEQYLNPIATPEDMHYNAQKLIKILRVDLLAYYIDARQTEQA